MYISANCTRAEATAASGSTARGKATLRTSVPLSAIELVARGERAREEHPRQQAAQQEQREALDRHAHDVPEGERVHGHHHERVQQRPRHAEQGALVLDGEIALDEAAEQAAVGHEGTEIVGRHGGPSVACSQ